VTDPAVPSCGNNCYDAGALLITAIQQNPLTAACMAQATGQVNVLYFSSIGTSGGTPPYTFKLNSGKLPPTLTLNAATGEISGTPTTGGTFTFSVKVTDSGSTVQTALTQECSITVIPRDLFILKDGPSVVAPGSVFDFTILVENNGQTPQLQVAVIDQL